MQSRQLDVVQPVLEAVRCTEVDVGETTHEDTRDEDTREETSEAEVTEAIIGTHLEGVLGKEEVSIMQGPTAGLK